MGLVLALSRKRAESYRQNKARIGPVGMTTPLAAPLATPLVNGGVAYQWFERYFYQRGGTGGAFVSGAIIGAGVKKTRFVRVHLATDPRAEKFI